MSKQSFDEPTALDEAHLCYAYIMTLVSAA